LVKKIIAVEHTKIIAANHPKLTTFQTKNSKIIVLKWTCYPDPQELIVHSKFLQILFK